ncbi:MAG TPA: hypothetical protein VHG71_01940 [Verrucomicrobiae bacterium]|nr:hypothetical protein [Verrucomicrobiae bacterium]
MKIVILAAITGLTLLAGKATAENAPQLSYGVPQILQLSQAKVSDNTIVTYIQNSGNSYGLDANQIIYLRQQGVSDTVLNAMLNQHGSQSQPTVSAAPVTQSQNNSSSVNVIQNANAPDQPAVTYVQPVPTSSVYIIPDTQTYNYYAYRYRPYVYNYCGYQPYCGYGYYPAVRVSFGYGGWRGGYGGYHRGGWHR